MHLFFYLQDNTKWISSNNLSPVPLCTHVIHSGPETRCTSKDYLFILLFQLTAVSQFPMHHIIIVIKWTGNSILKRQQHKGTLNLTKKCRKLAELLQNWCNLILYVTFRPLQSSPAEISKSSSSAAMHADHACWLSSQFKAANHDAMEKLHTDMGIWDFPLPLLWAPKIYSRGSPNTLE